MKILFLLFLSIISVNSVEHTLDLTYVHKKNVKQIVLRRGQYTTDILPKKQLTCFKKDSRNYQRNCNETLPIIICKNVTIDKDGKFNCLCTKNNVLVLEFDKYGVLQKKDFYNKEDMKRVNFAKSITENDLKKENFIYGFLSSIRQKMEAKKK